MSPSDPSPPAPEAATAPRNAGGAPTAPEPGAADSGSAAAAPRLLLLVDGSSYLYRAYHALPDLRGPGQVPTGAVRGMVAMLKKLRDDHPSALGACVFDAPGGTFRDQLYADYKAQRAPMPEDLAAQIAPIQEVVPLLGWPVFTVPGVEADDVIGTLASAARAQGIDVLISTGDKDLTQLVQPGVRWVNTMSGEQLDSAGVLAKFGVPPERIVDYLTLVGDSVDNIPGVDKVGPKTAAKWIQEYGSLDGVMAAAPTMKGAAAEHLRRALDWLPTGRDLVTVRTDCNLAAELPGWPEPAALEALRFRPPQAEALLAFHQRMGFRSWVQEWEKLLAGSGADLATGSAAPGAAKAGSAPTSGLAAPAPAAGAPAAPGLPEAARAAKALPLARRYTTLTDAAALQQAVEAARAAPEAALWVEAEGHEPMGLAVIGLAWSTTPGEGVYLPIAHAGTEASEQVPADAAWALLRSWLEDAERPKIVFQSKRAWHALAREGVALRGVAHDPLLQSYVLEAHRTHALEALADRHLGRRAPEREALQGKGVNALAWAQVAVAAAGPFAAECADLSLHLHRVLWPQLEASEGERSVYQDIEMPLAGVLAAMERHGVLVDPQRLAAQSHDLAQRMLALEREAYELAGQPFNMGSPKQIGEVLFGKLGLPVKKKTASGAPSTDEEVLQELAADYPLPKRILEHRSLAKLKGTYTDKLPLMIDAATGRVHTNYAQAVAVTGRLSSNDPNLQNIPIRTAEGRRVREAFVAPPGHDLVSIDYSQIELRLMAHMSQDEAMLAAFRAGEDIHRATAAEVFGMDRAAVDGEQRRYAKAINFGLIYGMGAFGLAQALGVEQKAARDFIERYFARFAGVRQYMERTRELAREQGFVSTLYGRRIHLTDIRAGGGPRRAAAERQAINAPMQGTAADLIKRAMIACDRAIRDEGRATRMVLQVHDELIFEVPKAERDWACTVLPRCMVGVAELDVPLVAEPGVGASWEAAH